MKVPQMAKWMNDVVAEMPRFYLVHWQIVIVSFDRQFPGDATGYVFLHLVEKEEGLRYVKPEKAIA